MMGQLTDIINAQLDGWADAGIERFPKPAMTSSTHPDAPRIVQSNDVAGIIIAVTEKVHPGEFVTLDLRYGIADALWAAGYRKVEGNAK